MARELDIWMKNVVYLRKITGLSKKEMAKRMGIGIESFNKIERGVMPKRLSVEVLFCVEKYFGITAEQQFYDIEKNREAR